MKKPINSYTLYEGNFLTTAPVLDRTINILMFRDPSDQEYQIIINRTTLAEDQTVEDWYELETENLRNKLPGFQSEGKLLKDEIGPTKLPIIQIANRYLNDGDIIRQVLSIISLPKNSTYNPEGREIIIFNLNTKNEFTDYQRQHYVRVINSFSPNMDD
ncbi:T6SS protein Cts1W [Izhakiella australiensis]|uniref:T6SS protein Cts1W n=1 Tax=Izhakiella australiensis TaxID=1926881 RepID=A0A1S8YM51_9GAMM|nr:DcrB-related protein [Izhakiella australiensis]OON40199.1 T6SS protein Cts1W [Izhakiella australiensis]